MPQKYNHNDFIKKNNTFIDYLDEVIHYNPDGAEHNPQLKDLETYIKEQSTDHIEELKPAIGYVRYSDLKQKGNHSIKMQKYEIENMAKSIGYFILFWCVDEAQSATHINAIKRPWMRILYQIASQEFFYGAIFFMEESRVSRKVTDFVTEVYNPIMNKKPYVKFFNAEDRSLWDPSDSSTQIKLLLNQYFSVVGKTRSNRFHLTSLHPDNLKDFKRPGASLPFAYKVMDEYKYNPSENQRTLDAEIDNSNNQADIVFLIYYLASWGYSNSIIAEFLNKAEIASPQGGLWSQGSIDYILHNLFYVGDTSWYRRHSKTNSKRKEHGQFELFENTHEAIIPRYLAQAVNQTRALKDEYGHKFNTPFLLKGIAKCSHCSEILKAKDTTSQKSKTKKRKYRCTSCKNYIDIDVVHNQVYSKFFQYLSKNIVVMKAAIKKEMKQWNNYILEKRTELKDIQKRIEYQKSIISQEEYEFMYDDFHFLLTEIELEKQALNEAELQIKSLLDEDAIEHLFETFFQLEKEALSLTELRNISLIFFKEVTINFEKEESTLNLNSTPFVTLNWVNQKTAN